MKRGCDRRRNGHELHNLAVTRQNNNDAYTVTVSNVAGSVSSQAALLAVTAAPVGINLLSG
jgi:hypothetical protein